MTADNMKALLEKARQDLKLQQQRESYEEDVFEAHLQRVQAEKRRSDAESLLAQALAGQRHTAPPHAVVIEVAPAPVLSVCIAAFCAEKLTASAWTAKTLERWQFTFRLLVEGLGDRPIDQVKREDMNVFMGRLRKLPSNAQKMPALAGKSFVELTDSNGYSLVSDGTVNDFMGRVSSFFKWAMKDDRHQLRSNPAEGVNVRHVKRTKRRPFSDDQLVALFSHESYRVGQFLHPHYYWLMPMSMLSGMRFNELCQLRLADFIEVGGVPVIWCADEGENQRGKSANATRRVPVHAELVRLPYQTNNARSEELANKASYKHPWAWGQRCIIPAVSFDEPNRKTGKNIWYRFHRADGLLWALAGIWATWTDKTAGEVLESYTMLTINADAHPLMSRMHKPDPKLGPDQQDKRSVIPIADADLHTWLTGSAGEAQQLLKLAPTEVFDAKPMS